MKDRWDILTHAIAHVRFEEFRLNEISMIKGSNLCDSTPMRPVDNRFIREHRMATQVRGEVLLGESMSLRNGKAVEMTGDTSETMLINSVPPRCM